MALSIDQIRRVPLGKVWVATLLLAVGTTALGQSVKSESDGQQASREPNSVSREDRPATSPPDDDPGYLPPGADPENRLFMPFLKHMAGDQVQFWTSPKELKKPDALKTFVPFAAFTGLLIAGDSWFAKQVPDKPNQLSRSKNISDYTTFSLIGASAGAYVLGHLTHNDHLRETGFLAGEAGLNSFLAAYALKEITQRPRPYEGNGHGSFFQGGGSFPSEHSAAAWSVASVIAHEYPGTMTQMAAYGLASLVTVTRVTAKQHFPSDAFVGSVLGWYFGRQVYRAHHDPRLGGAPWGTFTLGSEDGRPTRRNMASLYVPVDSWVYAAFERLSALGYVGSAYFNQRPWTRLECARLIEEAGEQLPQDEVSNNEALKLYDALAQEFRSDTERLEGNKNLGVQLDSVYTRITSISGMPLRDSFHFGQTIVDDYGRPNAEGVNLISGMSASAVAGPFAFYARGEYQQAPSSPLYPEAALQAISQADFKPVAPNVTAAASRTELLDSQVAFSAGNIQATFGKQSAWLGPTRSGSLLLSNNAAPFTMLRLETVSPFQVPVVSKLLGPLKLEFFLGELSGFHWIFNGTTFYPGPITPQPFIHGDRITFKPTENLEIGMGITALFGGPGIPFTWHNFLRTYYVHTTIQNNPGKRLSAADVSYRIPYLRNWVTFYLDSLVVDEYSPIGSDRPSLNPGVYFPRFPKLHALELRVEGIKTQQGPNAGLAPGFVYDDQRYKDGYTNGDNLILGNWIGRAGVGEQGWFSYHLSPRNLVEFSYRHVNVDHSFLQGGHITDFSVKSDWTFRSGLGLSGMVQYEEWGFPLLAPTAETNVTSSFQITYTPHWGVR